MPQFIVGARLHDYGRGAVDEQFAKVAADGFSAVQLAYKKVVPTVKSYADVTDELAQQTWEAEQAHGVQVAVLGTYVELALNTEAREKNVADFKSQLRIAKKIGAGCIGTETTKMVLQPAGTTREQAQTLLCRSLAELLPAAEELGVYIGIEAVTYHSMNDPAAVRRVLDTMRSPNLKVIFDMANMVNADNTDCQEKIGSLMSTPLEESGVDYAGAFAMLRQLPQKTLPVMREEAVPAKAASDIAYMRSFF